MADEPRLPERAEQLLASLPVPERDWEEQARAIEARLAATALGSTEAHWLQAPLPEDAPEALAAVAPSSAEISDDAVPGPTETPFPFDSMASIIEAPDSAPETAAAAVMETAAAQPAAAAVTPEQLAAGATQAPASAAPVPAAASATPVPGAGGSQSLAALARSVAQKSGRPQSRDLARESLSVAAAARSHSDAMAERVRSARPAPPPAPSQRPQRAAAAPATPAANSPANNRQLGPWIAVGGLGMAAAVALWVIARPAAPVTQTAPEAPAIAARALPPEPEAAPAAKSRAAESAETTALAAAPTQAPAAGDAPAPSMAASALPLAAPMAVAAVPVRGGAAAAPGAPPPTVAPASPAAAAGARPAPEAIVLEDTATTGKVAAGKAGAAPAAASGLRPAAGAPSGGLPDRPSTGAVQAAVGSVMGAARACVAGGVATPAQVIFGSDGTVQAVNVSGPNAGTASASCISAALRRARVAPFASQTFSLMVWVRP